MAFFEQSSSKTHHISMDKKSWAAPKKLSHSIGYGGWLIWILIMDDDHGENILGGIPGIPPKKRSSTNLNYPQPRMWFSSVTSSTTHRQQGPPHPFSRLWSNQGIKNAWWVKAIRTVQRSNASISPWISLGGSTGKRSHLKQIAMEVTKHRCDSFATRPQAIHTDWSALSATRSHKD